MSIRSLIIIFSLTCFIIPHGHATRIKDIVEVVGLHENAIMGMGLVVGLQKTGDKSRAALRALRNVLKRYRFNITEAQLTPGNVALVMVTAKLPPLMRKGSKIDVTISSVGDAKSLAGGVLLTTFLRALDKKVYAVAQGIINRGQNGSATVATISGGATIEREVPVALVSKSGDVFLRLKTPDFNTANRIVEAINRFLKYDSSKAIDMAMVQVVVPKRFSTNIAKFIAEIFVLRVVPDTPARVVINERTGTVIVGEAVTISPVTVSHNNITIRITETDAKKGVVTVRLLAQALLALRMSTRDLIAIFRMLKKAGALHAELIIA